MFPHGLWLRYVQKLHPFRFLLYHTILAAKANTGVRELDLPSFAPESKCLCLCLVHNAFYVFTRSSRNAYAHAYAKLSHQPSSYLLSPNTSTAPHEGS